MDVKNGGDMKEFIEAVLAVGGILALIYGFIHIGIMFV